MVGNWKSRRILENSKMCKIKKKYAPEYPMGQIRNI